MVCKEHSGLVEILKNIEDKLDTQIKHCMKTTNYTHKETDDLTINLARLDEKVNFLVKDRIEQKERYEKKIAFVRKVHYTIATSIAGVVSYAFINRETVREVLKEWLLK